MLATQLQQDRLSSQQFSFVCQYIYDVAGIVLDETKSEMVHRRLSKLLKTKGYSSFDDYQMLLLSQPATEQGDFVNALTTNLTSFFRESHHFETLKNTIIPELLERNRETKRIRIWSSACSTGEEPYTIAMVINKYFSAYLADWDIKVLATDIDTDVLSFAKEGIYSKEAKETIPNAFSQSYKRANQQQDIIMVDEVKDLITFKQLNLLGTWPMQGKFDVIFCRNVIIYFNSETQQTLFNRFHQYLTSTGHLILGHSEHLGQSSNKFQSNGRTMFTKS